MVYTFGNVLLLQSGINSIRPRRSPFLGFGRFVPIGRFNLSAFELAAFEDDFLAAFIKDISNRLAFLRFSILSLQNI